MNIKKPLLVMGAVAGVGLAGLTGHGVASAASGTPKDSLIDRLATRFHLNKQEVAAVFEEEKVAHQADMQQKMEARLDQAVKDGKITEAQKTKILAKLAELRTEREAWQQKPPQERRQARRELHDDLRQWAKDNDIPLELLHFKFVVSHHGPGIGKAVIY